MDDVEGLGRRIKMGGKIDMSGDELGRAVLRGVGGDGNRVIP